MAPPLENKPKKTLHTELAKMIGKEVQLRLTEVLMQGILIELGEDFLRIGGNGGHPSLVPLSALLYAQPLGPEQRKIGNDQ